MAAGKIPPLVGVMYLFVAINNLFSAKPMLLRAVPGDQDAILCAPILELNYVECVLVSIGRNGFHHQSTRATVSINQYRFGPDRRGDKYRPNLLFVYLCLILSGDIELNPGPTYKYPCVRCEKPVRRNQKGIQCDTCDKWYHSNCVPISDAEYFRLSNCDDVFSCALCSLPCLSESFFTCSSTSTLPPPSLPPHRPSNCDSSATNLLVVHMNIRSLLPHLDELKITVGKLKPDILVISESWLDNTIHDNEISIDGYHSTRHDRDRRGGGTIIYTRDHLSTKITLIRNAMTTSYDSIWLEVCHSSLPSTLLIGCIYRPPSCPAQSTTMMFSEIEEALSLKHRVIICGDLNINLLNKSHPSCIQLTNFLESHNLHQPITAPTRITSTSSTLIDVFLVSDHHLIKSSGVSNIAISDHLLIHLTLTWKRPKAKSLMITKRSFKHFDRSHFQSDLQNIPWSVLDIFDSPDDKLYCFEMLFNGCLDDHAPWRTFRSRKKRLPWITPSILKSIDLRNKLLKHFKQQPCPNTWSIYKHQRNQVTRLLRDSKKLYFTSLINGSAPPSKLWDCLKSALPSGPSSVDGFLHQDPAVVAETFNKHFNSVSSASSVSNGPVSHPVVITPCTYEETLDLLPVSIEECQDLLSSLNTRKATGPDNIPPRLLKESAHLLAPSLTNIINSSFTTGHYPAGWKHALVKPLHKSGDRCDLFNYRPISLLPTCSKIIEQTAQKQLASHLERNHLLHPLQSGFRSNHSTASTLLRTVDEWYRFLDSGMMIGVLFLDVAKAFDTVDHNILLSKLPTSLRLSSSTINWLTSYVSGRTHSTTVSGATSTPLSIKSGVPQGSILGPNLFSIHINDLPSICPNNTTTVLFADDATIYVIGSTVTEISNTLTSVLKDCHNWMSSNNLQLNINKTKCMLIHQPKRRTQPLNVSLNNSLIDQVKSFKLLGCIINHHLSWDDHIQHITAKVTRSINLLWRMSWFLPKKMLLMFYNSYVIPTFDYCDTVWSSGCTATQAQKLERLQNYACRIILKQPRTTSATQLRVTLNLPTLNQEETCTQ